MNENQKYENSKVSVWGAKNRDSGDGHGDLGTKWCARGSEQDTDGVFPAKRQPVAGQKQARRRSSPWHLFRRGGWIFSGRVLERSLPLDQLQDERRDWGRSEEEFQFGFGFCV